MRNRVALRSQQYGMTMNVSAVGGLKRADNNIAE